nr:Gag-Pol polyprotein [Tanacetum cinerariifolium]
MQEEFEALHLKKHGNLCHYQEVENPLETNGCTRSRETLMIRWRGPNKDRINKLKVQLAMEFEMKDLGPENKIPGLSSKMSPSSEKERMEMSRVPYASAVESLMFAMICTRPNITHAVGVVSRYMEKPGREHWEAVKRILRYIKGASDVKLCFGDLYLIVAGYVDSDYTGDLDGSESTIGSIIRCSCSSQQRSSMVEDVVGRAQYHIVRKKVEEGTVDIQKIHTDDNVAYYLTKAINGDKFKWCRSSCGLAEIDPNVLIQEEELKVPVTKESKKEATKMDSDDASAEVVTVEWAYIYYETRCFVDAPMHTGLIRLYTFSAGTPPRDIVKEVAHTIVTTIAAHKSKTEEAAQYNKEEAGGSTQDKNKETAPAIEPPTPPTFGITKEVAKIDAKLQEEKSKSTKSSLFQQPFNDQKNRKAD